MSEPIRVLHVVTHMNRGGLETMIMNYYRFIDRTKVQFDFLTHRDVEADYNQEIRNLGGKIFNLPKLNPFSIGYYKALKEFLKNSNYDIIHVHQDCMSSIVLKEAKKQKVAIRVSHAHSSNQDKNIKYIIKLFYKKFIKKYATHLFACGVEAGKWMFETNNFKVLNNAIDSEKYKYNSVKKCEMKKKLGIPLTSIVIGHVGRFSGVKNHSFLIDIFEKLSKQNDCYLVLVGDGDLKEQIEIKVKEKSLEKRVLFLGLRNDVHDLMQVMDVFVLPSLYEGLPLVLVEAQAAGIPCVISDNIPDDCVLTDLIKKISLNDDIYNWVELITQSIYQDKKITSEEIINKNFDIKANAKYLEDFYCSEYKKIKQT